MRDIALTGFILVLLPFVFKRPWLGILLWTWIGMMNPHRLTWGFAYSMPFAQIVGIVTLIAVLFSREPKRYPLTPVTVTLLLLVFWMNVSYLFRLDPGPYPFVQWSKVMTIQFFLVVTLVVMNSAERVRWLAAIAAFSIGFYGVKGGIFTLTSGGGSMVLGPDGSFISGNTEISLAITMAMPLLRYFQMQSSRRLVRWALGAAIALCAVAVLGSHSRGGMLAVAAMGAVLWMKSRNKVAIGFGILLLVPIVLSVMPPQWFDRMNTIGTYQEDGSAMGRINAWHMSFNMAKDRPLTGGGFGAFTDESFARWAPVPDDVHDAHSIWFQMLGEHGFVGLALFMLLWFLGWRLASGIIKSCRKRADLTWASDLAAMVQVSFVGFWVGGSFLGLSYWDMPYVMLSILVLTRSVVDKQLAVSAATVVAAAPLGAAPAQGRKVIPGGGARV